MINPNEPLPCLFCGSSNIRFRHTWHATKLVPGRAECNDCGACGPIGHSRWHAYRLWNVVPRFPSQEALLVELRKETPSWLIGETKR